MKDFEYGKSIQCDTEQSIGFERFAIWLALEDDFRTFPIGQIVADIPDIPQFDALSV